MQTGKFQEAISEYRRAAELSGETVEISASLAYAYALSGQQDTARRILQQLEESSKRRPVLAIYRAIIYIGLGDKQKAFAWLERAYEQHEKPLLTLKVEPSYDSLRSDPRFEDLMRRVGIPL